MSRQVLGLLHVAGLELALPLMALREVVPCPADLDPLAAEAPGLLGAMTLRGAVVPVVSLAVAVGRQLERHPGQVVVVLAREGRVVGLLVDEVKGMVENESVVSLDAEGGLALLESAFLHPESGSVVSVLSADALLALPGVPVVRELQTTAVQVPEQRTAGDDPVRSVTLVRCGEHLLALDTEAVALTVPSPRPAPSPVDGPTVLGTTEVAGWELGVVDTLALLGLGKSDADPTCGLVVSLDQGRAVLAASALVGLQDVPASRVLPLPPTASTAPALLRAVIDLPDHGRCLLVDTEGLRADATVAALGRLAAPVAHAEAQVQEAGTAARGGAPHLAASADRRTEVAVPLEQVAEVLGWPEDLLRTSGTPSVLGVLVHRGDSVPVVSLPALLGLPEPEHDERSRLLLVRTPSGPVALAVTALRAILPLTWQDPQGRRGAGRLGDHPLVQLGGEEGLVPRLDLVELATHAVHRPDLAIAS